MSEAEMRTAIRNQYPATMTLRDNLLMIEELRQLGLEGNIGDTTVTHIFASMAAGLFPNLPFGVGPDEWLVMEKIFDAMLDMPANLEDIRNTATFLLNNTDRLFYYNLNLSSSLDVLLKHLLASFSGSMDMADELMALLERTQERRLLENQRSRIYNPIDEQKLSTYRISET